MGAYVIAALTGYLLGSIPFGYILVKMFFKADVRQFGSGATGATNVARAGGGKLGIATLVLDALKGAVAVFAGMWINAQVNGLFTTKEGVIAVAAVAAIVGHCFPVWLSFRGGKGVATALGIFLAISWRPTVLALGVFILIFLLTKYVSLASIVANFSFIIFAFWLIHPLSPAMATAVIAVPLIVILKHHQNITRLLRGAESKFSTGKEAAA